MTRRSTVFSRCVVPGIVAVIFVVSMTLQPPPLLLLLPSQNNPATSQLLTQKKTHAPSDYNFVATIANVAAPPSLAPISLHKDLADFLDKILGRIDNLADRVDDLSGRVDDLSGRVDNLSDRVDDLSDRVDDLSGRVDDLSDRVDDLSDRVDDLSDRVDGLADLIQRTNPVAMLESINPPVVMGKLEKLNEVIKPSICTWTYMKRGSKYYAVSAKHCMFSNPTIQGYPAFAKIPLEALNAGVEKVGFTEGRGIREKVAYIQDDFAIVELKGLPNVPEALLHNIPEYPDINLSRYSLECARKPVAVGRGASSNVVGSGIAKRKLKVDEYFVTVLEFAEPGCSGTLMYSSVTCGALTMGEPFGVFSGRWDLTKKGKTASQKTDTDKFRFRGTIAPLPRFDDIAWRPILQPEKSPNKVETMSLCYGAPKLWNVNMISADDHGSHYVGVRFGSSTGFFLKENVKTESSHCFPIEGTNWQFDTVFLEAYFAGTDDRVQDEFE